MHENIFGIWHLVLMIVVSVGLGFSAAGYAKTVRLERTTDHIVQCDDNERGIWLDSKRLECKMKGGSHDCQKNYGELEMKCVDVDEYEHVIKWRLGCWEVTDLGNPVCE